MWWLKRVNLPGQYTLVCDFVVIIVHLYAMSLDALEDRAFNQRVARTSLVESKDGSCFAL